MASATQARVGYSTLWQDNSSGVMTTKAEVLRIGGPEPERAMIDATNITSPGEWEEVVPGIIKSGMVTIELQFILADATHRAILAAIESGAKINAQIVWPDGTIWSFSGYYNKFAPKTATNEKITATVTFKPTGALTIPT